MPAKCPIGLLLGAFVSLLGLSPSISAEDASGVTAYVTADSQNNNPRREAIERIIVREATAQESTDNGKPGASKRKNSERRLQEEKQHRGSERTPPKKVPRETPEDQKPSPEKPLPPKGPAVPEDVPEPGTGDIE